MSTFNVGQRGTSIISAVILGGLLLVGCGLFGAAPAADKVQVIAPAGADPLERSDPASEAGASAVGEPAAEPAEEKLVLVEKEREVAVAEAPAVGRAGEEADDAAAEAADLSRNCR